MTTTRITILALISLWYIAPGTAYAQKESQAGYLKNSNPNDLYVSFIQEGDCTVSYGSVVDEVLARSRITPLPYTFPDELNLSVVVRCLLLVPHPGFSFFVDARFGRLVTTTDSHPGEMDVIAISYDSNYERFGIVHDESTGEQEMSNAIREVVEVALTDYRNANGDF